jgi:ABC-2 type transport system permease protein
MKPFTTLVKRELWENQSIFLYVPVGITMLMVILLMLSLFVMNVRIDSEVRVSSTIDGDHRQHELVIGGGEDAASDMPIRELVITKIRQLASEEPDERNIKVNGALQLLNSPLRLVLILVLFYYLMGCLYEERKNRTILFWKSMPVSDSATIGSKLAAAFILTPLIFFVCMLITDICALLMTSILAALADVPVWDLLWSGTFGYWLSMPLLYVIYVCWALPLIGWVLFVSSFARSIPLMWAVGIPVVIFLAEAILFGSGVFRDFMMRHASVNLGLRTAEGFLDAQGVLGHVLQLDMLIGLALGLIFIIASIWKRGSSDET